MSAEARRQVAYLLNDIRFGLVQWVDLWDGLRSVINFQRFRSEMLTQKANQADDFRRKGLDLCSQIGDRWLTRHCQKDVKHVHSQFESLLDWMNQTECHTEEPAILKGKIQALVAQLSESYYSEMQKILGYKLLSLREKMQGRINRRNQLEKSCAVFTYI